MMSKQNKIILNESGSISIQTKSYNYSRENLAQKVAVEFPADYATFTKIVEILMPDDTTAVFEFGDNISNEAEFELTSANTITGTIKMDFIATKLISGETVILKWGTAQLVIDEALNITETTAEENPDIIIQHTSQIADLESRVTELEDGGMMDTKISEHNQSNTSHGDIRQAINSEAEARDEADQQIVSDFNQALGNKVNKETGKGLSTNDYTTEEKQKLAGINEGAEVNTVETVNEQSPDENKNISLSTTVIPEGENQYYTVKRIQDAITKTVAGLLLTTTALGLSIDTADGYTVPLIADVQKGITAHGWGNHADAGYASQLTTYTKSEVDTLLSGKQNSLGYTAENIANKGQALGYAGLDAGGKVHLSQLPGTLLIYKGVWNANTNNPNLTTPDLTKVGQVYNVSVAGTQFGIDWKLGDWAIYNDQGIIEKSDNSDDVVSVNGKQGVVVLTTSDIGEGTNLYFTNTRARESISTTATGLTYDNFTGVLSLTNGYLMPQTAQVIPSLANNSGKILTTDGSNPLFDGTIIIDQTTKQVTISKSVADAKPALIVNQANGATGYIAELKYNSTTKFYFDISGRLSLVSLINQNSDNNSTISPTDYGTSITRNVNDSNTCLTVNQLQGTGKILDLQFGGATKLSVDRFGNINATSVIKCSNGIENSSSSANARYQPSLTGSIIARDRADTNTCLIINQVNAGSTGKILDCQAIGTTVTSVLIDGSVTGNKTGTKFKITAEGGYAIALTNKTGANSVKGTVVRVSSTTDNAFEINAIDSDTPIGVVYESGIADGSACWVVVSGIADVLLVDTVATTRGYFAYSSATTAGRIDTSATIPANTQHWREIGHTLESITAGTDKLVKCVLHFN